MSEGMTSERWRSMSEYERCAWLEENADRIVVKSYATGEKSLILLSEMPLSERAREVIALSERAAPPSLSSALNDYIVKTLARINSMKEAIIQAFIAETGCKPSECELVEVRELAEVRWFVRRRTQASDPVTPNPNAVAVLTVALEDANTRAADRDELRSQLLAERARARTATLERVESQVLKRRTIERDIARNVLCSLLLSGQSLSDEVRSNIEAALKDVGE